jgi:hypothetical protein
MKKFWAALAIIAVVAALVFLFQFKTPPAERSAGNSGTGPANSSKPSVAPVNSQNAAPAPSAGPAATAAPGGDLASRAASPNSAPSAPGDTNEPPLLPPATVLDKARVVIHNYHAAFGENPVGTNPEITAALSGKNPKSVNFVAESGLRVNANGEMLDGYGTPFFFHQISGQEMEIRSAGPDRVMWTFDDVVTR